MAEVYDPNRLFSQRAITPIKAPSPAWMNAALQLSAPPANQNQITTGEMFLGLVRSGVVGSILGTLHSELKNGLDVNGVPVDLVFGSISSLCGRIFQSENARSVGENAVAVYTFRKTEKLLSAIRARRTPIESESSKVAAE